MINKNLKILSVVGARPNFIKIAPLLNEIKRNKEINSILVHTGQHYDYKMSKSFFDQLKIPKPDYNLEVGSGSHTWQTSKIMEKLEPILIKEKPRIIIVVGDVNSTIASALASVKLGIKIAHIESGLRSKDYRMAEEINRILTDRISDYLFVTEESGVKNLLKEGIDRKKIFFVGNVIIDTLINFKKEIKKSNILNKLKIKPKKYAFLTLHRPENVDNKEIFVNIISAIIDIQKSIKVLWPIHPRAEKQLEKFGIKKIIEKYKNIQLISPMGYFDNLNLIMNSKFVMTDSGGIQEETSFLNVPCLTLRDNTERPVTIIKGTNYLVGIKREKIIKYGKLAIEGDLNKKNKINNWDGKAAKRIIKILLKNETNNY